eukprot:3096784-Alexandrium_andersonii.AAC.1
MLRLLLPRDAAVRVDHHEGAVWPREFLGPEAMEERPPETNVLRSFNDEGRADAALLKVGG